MTDRKTMPTFKPMIESLDPRTLFANPSVRLITAPESLTSARRDTTITLALNLPNGAVNFSKLYRDAFRVYEVAADGTETRLPTGTLQTSGGGDTLSITTTDPLKAYTNYEADVNLAGYSSSIKVRDVTGHYLDPYSFTFKTGSEISIADPSINFSKQLVASSTNSQAGAYTCVTTGPDNKLYASTLDGYVYRWAINGDGTLGTRETITTVLDNNTSSDNPDGNRIITGITFDPDATASHLKLWVSHGQYKLGSTASTGTGVQYQADNYTGKISVLSGASLQSYNDVIVGIPRSVKDHMNNQIAFDPAGNNFYFNVAAMNAMGRADSTWGLRDENALSAAMFKVNLAKLDTEMTSTGGPIDLTNATYPATDTSKALNIYATGIRNGYDIVFASNGHIYNGINGSSAGGNTPAGGGAPALTNVPQTEEDYLLDVQQGKYYGHPNPARGQYVLDGGNPTSDVDPYEFAATSTSANGALYPVGVQPDSNYTLPAYDIGRNVSPDGMIEYQAVNGKNTALDNTLLICRYNSGQDILAMKPNSDGTVSKANVQAGITGLTGLANPLDITEDSRTGNLYVAQLERGRPDRLDHANETDRPEPGLHAEQPERRLVPHRRLPRARQPQGRDQDRHADQHRHHHAAGRRLGHQNLRPGPQKLRRAEPADRRQRHPDPAGRELRVQRPRRARPGAEQRQRQPRDQGQPARPAVLHVPAPGLQRVRHQRRVHHGGGVGSPHGHARHTGGGLFQCSDR